MLFGILLDSFPWAGRLYASYGFELANLVVLDDIDILRSRLASLGFVGAEAQNFSQTILDLSM